ncbi:oxidoreductase [Silvanigrella paludirubra]|uniref:Oxidoreductase n=2 Tax=Silvanigrella paludirubra TaxID=2499159 RepID=A0A6N6VTM2_9BACT|nr:oxidoreductase [Silvanigrella paludirubra]
MEFMKKINTAIVGFGLSGSTFHAPVFLSVPHFEFKYVVSSKPENIKLKYPNVKVISNFNDLLNLSDLDLIIITTPNNTHYSLAKLALLSGKNVIVDKPFVLKFQEGLELCEIARSKNLFLSVYQNRRWDNGFLTLKKCLSEDLLGEIFNYESYFDRFRPIVSETKWRELEGEGTGLLFDLGSHLIDQAIELFGMPEEILADIEMQRNGAKAIDYFKLIFKYKKLRVTIGASSIMSLPRPVLSVHGTKGSFVKYELDPQENELRAGKTPLISNWGEEREGSGGAFVSLLKDEKISESKIKCVPGSYQEYYEKVFQSLINKNQNPVEPLSALNVIKLIELSLESASSKKWIVINS